MLGLIIFYVAMGIALFGYIVRKNVIEISTDAYEDYMTVNKLGVVILWVFAFIISIIVWPLILLLSWFGINS